MQPLDDVSDELRDLEQSLLDPAVRRSFEAVDRLLADGFVEFGSSGYVYDKPAMLRALAEEAPTLVTMTNFRAHALGDDVVLVTYHTTHLDDAGQPRSRSLRSSLWKKRDESWQLVFHQGTWTALG